MSTPRRITPRRVTRAGSREPGASAVNAPETSRRARQAGGKPLERPPVPTVPSNAYGAAGTPYMPQQLAEGGPVNAVQAIAAGVEIAVKTTTGPQAGPQARPGNPEMSGIAEEGEIDEDDEDGDARSTRGNNPPTKNALGNRKTSGNNTTGNTTGNTNTFDDPSDVLNDVTLRLKQQTSGGRNARRPVKPVIPVLRRADPPRFTLNSFLNLLSAFLMLGCAWWFWTWGPVIKAQYGIGTPYDIAQHLGQRLGLVNPDHVGTRFQRGNAPGKTTSAPEITLLLQRINSLERRLDATPLAEAAVQTWQTRQINHFAIGAGAVIDPLITSPTKSTRRPLLQKLKARFFRLYLPEGFGPMAALSPWDDIGDCWCAPPTSHPWAGRAQIGVLLPRKVFPSELVIEHIPASATFDIHAAPKELELWAKIEDDAAREAVGNAIFPDDSIADNPGDSTRKFDDPMKSLDHTYVRIGRWKYDIHAPNNIQTFRVLIDLRHFNAVVNKVVVRSLSNWGVNSYTCFYRLKLHGDLAFPGVREEDKHLPEKTWLDHASERAVSLFWDWL